MPRQCSVCSSPQRDLINTAIAESVPYRDTAERFGTSTSALARHARHIETAAGNETVEPVQAEHDLGDVSVQAEPPAPASEPIGSIPQPGDLVWLYGDQLNTGGLYWVKQVEGEALHVLTLDGRALSPWGVAVSRVVRVYRGQATK